MLRRTLPAIAIVIGGFIGMRLWISQDLRMHFMTPVTTFYGVAANFTTPAGSINVGGGLLNKAGQVVTGPQKAGYRQFISYQPISRYWAFQGIETGIYLAVAAALIAITFYAVRRRDA